MNDEIVMFEIVVFEIVKKRFTPTTSMPATISKSMQQ